ALNGLGSEFKEVAAALRTREKAIAFDELHDLLVDYETFLQRDHEPAIIPTAHVAYRGQIHKVTKNGLSASIVTNRDTLLKYATNYMDTLLEMVPDQLLILLCALLKLLNQSGYLTQEPLTISPTLLRIYTSPIPIMAQTKSL
ncbi:hypothetical protein A2U01_0046197, partial [Trifolium medium]|nr:hypothetical protein [Trifolium medium]